MKRLDRILARWRAAKVIRFVEAGNRILDVGCHDGSLLKLLGSQKRVSGLGIDPEHLPSIPDGPFRFIRGHFPDALPADQKDFDVVCALAVLEHVPEEELSTFIKGLHDAVAPMGRVVLTIPSPIVDTILDVLLKIRLIEGMESEQHHGFDVKSVVPLFESRGLQLVTHRRFQLGLNHLFVFTRN